MKLAIPVFNGYVSPRVDCTRTFTLLDISEGEVVQRDEVSIPPMHPLQLAGYLKSRNIQTIICGGIPFPLIQVMQQHDMKVIYGIIGEIDEVVDAFIRGTLHVNHNFCFARRCGRGRRHHGGGRGFGRGGMEV